MCNHNTALTVRSGVLRPEELLVDFSAAWCPSIGCGAFRDASETSKPKPWIIPGTWDKNAYELENQTDISLTTLLKKKTKPTKSAKKQKKETKTPKI